MRTEGPGFEMPRPPLIQYVIAVAITWAIVLGIAWLNGRFDTFVLICFGFALGMLAMYIAMHLYRS